ncbi:MAG: aconitate hydratase [Verrucomicrobia bacterium]|nr:aconitate hydratase [Verrucomicrobiota bacterium]
MNSYQDRFGIVREFDAGDGKVRRYYSLPALEKSGAGAISRLPVSLRLVLESVVRNVDGVRVKEQNALELAAWKPNATRTSEIPFMPARVLLQDFTGVPLLVDLAAMRSAVARLGSNPRLIEPLVPVDLVVDHSVQVDFAGRPDAFRINLEMEFMRNRERYEFLKWGTRAFQGFRVIPPGIGIVHQVNLEFLAKGVLQSDEVWYPDTLVGTDSHTTMINGLGIVGWGVGGIEAEAGMLGLPVSILTPDVVGVHLSGKLRGGVTATDAALAITQLLRKAGVVGKFVEFYGEGAAALPVVDRATIANMAPEYGATLGFFPIDDECAKYLRATGRSDLHVRVYEAYYKAQGMWGIPRPGEIDYSANIDFDLAKVEPSVAGPKRPQDRIGLSELKSRFRELLAKPVSDGGYGKAGETDKRVVVKSRVGEEHRAEWTVGTRRADLTASESEMRDQHPAPDNVVVSREDLKAEVRHGSVVIAAITSCTNTSNPSLMLAAGLVAKKAVERGLRVNPAVKTSLAPGSRVVTDYLEETGLQKYLDELGFHVVGYGCTTCIGNSGPLETHLERAIVQEDLVVASVLSGNRNFEARVHPTVKANFLMSPPLVVVFAIAGRVDIDLSVDPVGVDSSGRPVFLKDLWPSAEEISGLLPATARPEAFRSLYGNIPSQSPKWNDIPSVAGDCYVWDPASTYVQEPPFFNQFTLQPGTIAEIKGARALAIFGDSVTTDHISPAGAIKPSSPAGQYLISCGVRPTEFNSYGARRGNDKVMTRGTFANVRIKNLMLGGEEGGYTLLQPAGRKMTIYDAAMEYRRTGTPLIVIAGHEYGTGSSRDWAAKGTALLGVKAVVARSFERIHRSNLIGMGVLPLQFRDGDSAESLGLNGTETYDVLGLGPDIVPGQEIALVIHRASGVDDKVAVRCRLDTEIEVEYYRHGGILPYVLREVLRRGIPGSEAGKTIGKM